MDERGPEEKAAVKWSVVVIVALFVLLEVAHFSGALDQVIESASRIELFTQTNAGRRAICGEPW